MAKGIKVPKKQPTRQSRTPAWTAAQQTQKKASGAGLGIALLIVGFVLPIIPAIMVSDALETREKSYQQRFAAIQADIEKVRDDIARDQPLLDAERQRIADKIEKEIAAQRELILARKTVASDAEALTSELDELASQKALKAATAEELEKKVEETRAKVAELRQKAEETKAARDKLKAEYRHRYSALEKEVEQAIERPTVSGIRGLYDQYKHSMFGACAAFYTGEKMLANKDYKNAPRYYQIVVDDYRGSPYADLAATRLDELEAPLYTEVPDPRDPKKTRRVRVSDEDRFSEMNPGVKAWVKK